MSGSTLKLAVFISGGGTNLQSLIDSCAKPEFPAEIQVVISNEADAYGLTRAENAGIPALCVPHREHSTRAEFEAALQEALQNYEIDLICLAGFMRILSASFIERWENKIINTHPSLLPKFGGEGMYGQHVHRAVLDAGEKVSGCTIHTVIPDVDKGEILVQKTVPVLDDDTPESLAARVLEQEHIAYTEAVEKIALEKGYISSE